MKKILVCNQKMYLTPDEAKRLKDQIDTLDVSKIELVICPSYLNYEVFNEYLLGAQDSFYEDKGPYTGKVSAYELSLRGIKYSLVGHSETRDHDDDKIINLKLKAILRNSMTPILCVGETKLDRELRRTPEVIKKQLETALSDIKLDNYQTLYVAYEPRYLIGGKNVLSKTEIIDAISYIKKIIDYMGIKNYKLLYGGSVNSKNVDSVLIDCLDGLLLGLSSVSFDELRKIIECIK